MNKKEIHRKLAWISHELGLMDTYRYEFYDWAEEAMREIMELRKAMLSEIGGCNE